MSATLRSAGRFGCRRIRAGRLGAATLLSSAALLGLALLCVGLIATGAASSIEAVDRPLVTAGAPFSAEAPSATEGPVPAEASAPDKLRTAEDRSDWRLSIEAEPDPAGFGASADAQEGVGDSEDNSPAAIRALLLSKEYDDWETAAKRILDLFRADDAKTADLDWVQSAIEDALVGEPANEQRISLIFTQFLSYQAVTQFLQSDARLLTLVMSLALHPQSSLGLKARARGALVSFAREAPIWKDLVARIRKTPDPNEFELLFTVLLEQRFRETIGVSIRRLSDSANPPKLTARITGLLGKATGLQFPTPAEWSSWWETHADRALIEPIRARIRKEQEDELVRLWDEAYKALKFKSGPNVQGWLLAAVQPENKIDAIRIKGFVTIINRAFELSNSATITAEERVERLRPLFRACLTTAGAESDVKGVRKAAMSAMSALAEMSGTGFSEDPELLRLLESALDDLASGPVGTFEYEFGQSALVLVDRLGISRNDKIQSVLEQWFPREGDWSTVDYALLVDALSALQGAALTDEIFDFLEVVYRRATHDPSRREVFSVLKEAKPDESQPARSARILGFYRSVLQQPQTPHVRLVISGVQELNDAAGLDILAEIMLNSKWEVATRTRALRAALPVGTSPTGNEGRPALDDRSRAVISSLRLVVGGLTEDDPFFPVAWEEAVSLCASDPSLSTMAEFVAPFESGQRPSWTQRILAADDIAPRLQFAPNYWNFTVEDSKLDRLKFSRWIDLEIGFSQAQLEAAPPSLDQTFDPKALAVEAKKYQTLALRIQAGMAAVFRTEDGQVGEGIDWPRGRLLALYRIATIRSDFLNRAARGELATESLRELIAKSEEVEVDSPNEVLCWMLSRMAAFEWREGDQAFLTALRSLVAEYTPSIELEEPTVRWFDRVEKRRPAPEDAPSTDG